MEKLIVQVEDNIKSTNAAYLLEIGDFRIIASIPRHWPANHSRIERLEEVAKLANAAQYSPVEVSIALALYGYNVSAIERARKIYEHFDGNCAELDELVRYMVNYGSAPTAMAFPSVEVYVQHALEKYGEEAKNRVKVERKGQILVEQMRSRAER